MKSKKSNKAKQKHIQKVLRFMLNHGTLIALKTVISTIVESAI